MTFTRNLALLVTLLLGALQSSGVSEEDPRVISLDHYFESNDVTRYIISLQFFEKDMLKQGIPVNTETNRLTEDEKNALQAKHDILQTEYLFLKLRIKKVLIYGSKNTLPGRHKKLWDIMRNDVPTVNLSTEEDSIKPTSAEIIQIFKHQNENLKAAGYLSSAGNGLP